jgi:uncharacterized repeat protein (TIGR03803 family)
MTKRNNWKLAGLMLLCAATLVMAPAVTAQITYSNLHTFVRDGVGGSEPIAALVLDGDGNLYGTTDSGGSHQLGTVFKLTPGVDGKWTETVLFNFAGAKTGSNPVGQLIFDQAGNLYGTTSSGGSNNFGTVFELSPGTNGKWTEKLLHNFAGGTDGLEPNAGVIFDGAGNLYGTTFRGGGSTNCWEGCGTVFELSPTAGAPWTETVLYRFCPEKGCSDGETPYASVILDSAGNLYGTTGWGGNAACGSGMGCGVVFELSPNGSGGWTQSVIHTFCTISNCPDGANPLDSLIFDQAGNLYGTAEQGGTVGGGIVFELSPGSGGSWTGKVLHNFRGTDGDAPYANLIFDSTGNLFGTTFEGGAGGGGVVYELSPNSKGGWNEITLHNFYDNPGAILWSGVIMDSAGNLYGTTYGDSNNTFGSVYKITP